MRLLFLFINVFAFILIIAFLSLRIQFRRLRSARIHAIFHCFELFKLQFPEILVEKEKSSLVSFCFLVLIIDFIANIWY